jgi:hypothetical protein
MQNAHLQPSVTLTCGMEGEEKPCVWNQPNIKNLVIDAMYFKQAGNSFI